MEHGDMPDPSQHGVRCPFLGQTIDASTLICLSDVESIAISRRYADSYCLTVGHVQCSLYIAALGGERSMPPEVLAAAHAPPGTTLLTQTASPGDLTVDDAALTVDSAAIDEPKNSATVSNLSEGARESDDELPAADDEGMPQAEAAFMIAHDEQDGSTSPTFANPSVNDQSAIDDRAEAEPPASRDTASLLDDDTVIETRSLTGRSPARAEAIQLAENLSERVVGLHARIMAGRANNEVLVQRVAALEELAHNSDFLRRAMETVPGTPLQPSELRHLQSILQSLLENPQDLAGLVQLAQGGGRLGHAVTVYARVIEALTE